MHDKNIKLSLKAARVNKGLSLEKAALMIGVCKKSIYGYESGKRSPNVATLKKMLEVYDIDYSDLRI